jgi:WD40 repeat protein
MSIELDKFESKVKTISFSISEEEFAIGLDDNTIRLYDKSNQIIKILKGHYDSVT